MARSVPSTCRPSPRPRPDAAFRRGSPADRLAPLHNPRGLANLRDIEMSYIQAVLEKHNGNKPAASKELGISLKTLSNKINQLQHN